MKEEENFKYNILDFINLVRIYRISQMPYKIYKVHNGYMVGHARPSGIHFFSTHPLTKEGAMAQLRALYVHKVR